MNRYCANCSQSIDHLRKDAKYCSDACRMKAYYERHGIETKQPVGERQCANPKCENMIPPDRKSTAKYCRPACRKLVYHDKKEAQIKFYLEMLK